MRVIQNFLLALLAITIAWMPVRTAQSAESAKMLNVSYDPTREFYEAYNALFAAHWKQETGQDILVQQSHGGSGKQARSVIDGLQADVVTLALAYDIDMIAQKAGALPLNWQEKLPNHSVPSSSTIVFLVKKGNPKAIKDWNDLVREGVQVITPNPKTSGGARWNYLAAYGYALKHFNGDKTKAEDFMRQLFAHVPVLDAGARGATTTFVQRGIGDVLVTWENEAFLAVKEFGKGQFDMVIPSLSIRTDPPVAVLEKVAIKKGNLKLAEAYLNYLYSTEAQKLAGKYYFRPSDAAIAAQYTTTFPKVEMIDIASLGGWAEVQKAHFDDGGLFDRVTARK